MAVHARLEENDCHCGNCRHAHRKSGSKHLSTFSFIGATPAQELAALFTVPLHCTDSVATLLYNVHKIRFARYSGRRKQIPQRHIATDTSVAQYAGRIGPGCAPGRQQTG